MGKEGKRVGGNVLSGATGIAGGKEYMISVNSVHASKMILHTSPIGPNQKGPWGILFLPLINRHTTGIA